MAVGFVLLQVVGLLYLLLVTFSLNADIGLPFGKKPLEFLRKFGYLESREGEGQIIESLYTSDTISTAIREAQKFGGLPQTGELDNNTLKLMQSRRCGVQDVLREPPRFFPRRLHFHRHKRYVIASPGWNRRLLTYYIGNWTPKLEVSDVRREVKKAFDTWGKYGKLDFIEIRNPYEADIVINFYRGQHGDMFPFDGPGLVLAHAYFPSMGSLGGDIHFDDDEDWKTDMKPHEEGVDFGAVALHEMGHSLGLAHSPERNSIMNPYYKGEGKELGYDDILAMHKLYVARRLEDDEDWHRWKGRDREPVTRPHHHHPTESPRTDRPTLPQSPPPRHPPQPTSPPTQATTQPTRTTSWGYQGDDESVETHKGHDHTHRIPPKQQPERNSSACNGKFTTVANIRGELFIVKDQMVWRLSDPGEVLDGYPVKLHDFFHKLPQSVQYVDEIFQRNSDSSIIFVIGKEYWIFNGYDFIEDSPRPLTDFGIPAYIKKIDAVLSLSKDSETYFFGGGEYWKWKEGAGRLGKGSVDDFKGIPRDLDAALTWKDGKSYFFKGDDYWAFDMDKMEIKESYPRSASKDWLSC